jgi:hypothetical protein
VGGIMNMAGGIGAVLSPALIPRVLGHLPSGWSPTERWRVIFAGLAVSWFLGAVSWLFVDASRPLFPTPEPASPPPEPPPYNNTSVTVLPTREPSPVRPRTEGEAR